MAPLPPWLNITPDQFMQAMQAGAQLGAQIGSSRGQQASPIRRGGGIPVRGGYTPPAAPVAPPVATDDGFSADRLSYSVANDAGKMAGQAGAAEDARLAYNATLNHPDVNKELYPPVPSAAETADAKRRDWELNQKLLEARALQEQKSQVPEIRSIENQIVRVNPGAGTAEVLHTAPRRPATPPRQSALDRLLGEGSAPQSVNAPPGAIAYLRSNPQFAEQFDQKYGEGSAATVLGE